MSRSLPSRAMHAVFSRVNRRRQWWQLPTTSLKALNLLSLRLDLRDMNLPDEMRDKIQEKADRGAAEGGADRTPARRPAGTT